MSGADDDAIGRELEPAASEPSSSSGRDFGLLDAPPVVSSTPSLE